MAQIANAKARSNPHPPEEVAVTEHLLIDDATIVTIAGERIAEVGEADALRQKYPQATLISGRGKVLPPGLINCHTHLSMSLQKGTTLAVADGLYRVMWPVERALTAKDCCVGALAGAAEALKGGTTTAMDHYFFMERVARAISV